MANQTKRGGSMTLGGLTTADGYGVYAVAVEVMETMLGLIQGSQEFIWEQKVDRAIENTTQHEGPIPWHLFLPEGLDRARDSPPMYRVNVRLNCDHVFDGDKDQMSMDGTFLGIIFFSDDAMSLPLIDVIRPFVARVSWETQAKNWA